MEGLIRHRNYVSQADWFTFRDKVPLWQERHISGLLESYESYLHGEEGTSSERFWQLLYRIRRDSQTTGVGIRVRKKRMLLDLLALLEEGVITTADLECFSEALRENIRARQNAADSQKKG